MRTSIALGHFLTIPETLVEPGTISCQEAFRGCIPSFVFSVNGQSKFRDALDHLLICQKRDCTILRKKVKDGMYEKLQWLFREDALLGCIHVQPFLYRAQRTCDVREQRYFLPVATHLSQCPHESCARLRRSLLLKVRDLVSPANQQPA